MGKWLLMARRSRSVQVSETPPESEDLEGSGLAEGSGMFEGSGLFEGSGDDGEGSGFGEGGDEDEEDVPIYFYLEESTGYMQPTLSFLAILHTVISFICIIGYNCLKVRQQGGTSVSHGSRHQKSSQSEGCDYNRSSVYYRLNKNSTISVRRGSKKWSESLLCVSRSHW